MSPLQDRRAKEMAADCLEQLRAVIDPRYVPSREVQLIVEVLCRAIVETTVPSDADNEAERGRLGR